jgi:diguanylate cyclase (GGDEF)-like protein
MITPGPTFVHPDDRKPVTTTQTDPDSAQAREHLFRTVRDTLAGILDERELYAAIHRATVRILPADGFYIARYDSGTDVATVVYWADQGEGREASITYPGSRSEVIRTGRSTLVEDHLESRSLMVLGEEGRAATRSAISAPMRNADGVIGAISAQSRQPGAYSRDDLEVLQGVADLAAAALDRTRRASTLERRGREAERLAGALQRLVGAARIEEVLEAAAEGSMELVPGDGAVVWLLDGGTARAVATRGSSAPERDFEVALVGEGARVLVEERRELLLDDLPDSPFIPAPLRQAVQARSALAVPLISEGEVAGVISVGTGASRPFTPDEASLLRRFSDAAGSALGRARLLARIEAYSLTDSLTGLPNRRHVELHLARELAAARRGRALSVVLFDVDSFRRYNNTLGRVAGDEVLRTMGEVLAAETRAMNLVGRYGGDEFLAILSDTPREGAELHAERVEERVARHSGLGPHGITVSSGVATFSEDMKSPQDLIRAADRDLRQAAPVDALE